MYESPIEFVTSELTKQLEGDVLTLAQSYGVRVDKDELIRALNYDRQQYEKGFADGKAAAANWIPCSEKLPEGDEAVLANLTEEHVTWTRVLMIPGSIVQYEYAKGWVDAWMPLPEAYKEGG